jgi:hypothetical protein
MKKTNENIVSILLKVRNLKESAQSWIRGYNGKLQFGQQLQYWIPMIITQKKKKSLMIITKKKKKKV